MHTQMHSNSKQILKASIKIAAMYSIVNASCKFCKWSTFMVSSKMSRNRLTNHSPPIIWTGTEKSQMVKAKAFPAWNFHMLGGGHTAGQ